ncbi:hypothetical protein [Maribacter polysiphoniae]|uniref:hypothetical protein n=1 Tax=Maribacter polysiphoniae TaxID=429344 RepID=UPI002352390B|nr:hypothetical protein [Maribacter polysiphoniae]
MKQCIFTLLCILTLQVSNAQTDLQNTSDTVKETEVERKAVIKKVEKEKRKAAKIEKDLKKKAQKKKQAEKLDQDIKAKEKAIAKNERKIIAIQDKLGRGTLKGKLSPVDIEKMKAKMGKLKSTIAKDKIKLEKLNSNK